MSSSLSDSIFGGRRRIKRATRYAFRTSSTMHATRGAPAA